jgi:multidrug efflux system membrane fusion protein
MTYRILLCTVLSAALCGCRSASDEHAPLPVTIARVSASGSAFASPEYTANIKPESLVELSFITGGYVDSIAQTQAPGGGTHNVGEGDFVKKDTVLAVLRLKDYDDKVAMARGQAGEAAALLADAESDFGRAKRLFDKNSLTKPEFDGAQAKYDAAKARNEAAQAQLATALRARDDSSLKAPMDCLVLRRNVEAGMLVSPGTPGFVIADMSRAKAVFGVPDSAVKTLRVGMHASLNIDSLGTLRGDITRISPAADLQGRVFDVEVAIPNPKGIIKAGMIASIHIDSGAAARNGPVVPLSAVVKMPGENSAYAVYVAKGTGDNRTAELRRIETGGFSANDVRVTSGLADGEDVIVRGASIVADGQNVRVVGE